MATIYRVENGDGEGPYRSRCGKGIFIVRKHHNLEKHPMPNMWPNEDWCFGFSSLQLLDQWFGGYLNELQEKGFNVVAYEAPKDYYEHINRQSIFNKEESEYLGVVENALQ